MRVVLGATTVLDELDLAVDRGELVALLGASGCGKTTLLRAVCGFAPVGSGRIVVDGRPIQDLPPERRDTALVFESYALWPHMTAARNIGYGLRVRGWPKEPIAARVGEMLALLGLEGLGQRNVRQLSGGQPQRLALGRALAVEPRLLLLDEPLSNLDARIRLELPHEIRSLQRRLGITALHVTHDREEAMVMADRIAVVDRGRIVQLDSPQGLWHRPASPFVAAFMGADNRVELAVEPSPEGLAVRAPDGTLASLPARARDGLEPVDGGRSVHGRPGPRFVGPVLRSTRAGFEGASHRHGPGRRGLPEDLGEARGPGRGRCRCPGRGRGGRPRADGRPIRRGEPPGPLSREGRDRRARDACDG